MRASIPMMWLIVLLGFVSFTGCDGKKSEIETATTQPHLHDEGDELVWPNKDYKEQGLEIWCGHHGNHFHAGDTIEPAIAIIKDGKPVSDATVTVGIVDSSAAEFREVPTVYEPETEEEIAHYAQGELKIPANATSCLLRYKILVGGEEISQEVKVSVGHD